MTKQYGLDPSKIQIKPESWKTFGAAGEIHRPDSKWPVVLYEPQAEKYETSGCTIWGSQNQIEIFIKEVFGFEPNYLEQFNYNDVGVNHPGSDPDLICE